MIFWLISPSANGHLLNSLLFENTLPWKLMSCFKRRRQLIPISTIFPGQSINQHKCLKLAPPIWNSYLLILVVNLRSWRIGRIWLMSIIRSILNNVFTKPVPATWFDQNPKLLLTCGQPHTLPLWMCTPSERYGFLSGFHNQASQHRKVLLLGAFRDDGWTCLLQQRLW